MKIMDSAALELRAGRRLRNQLRLEEYTATLENEVTQLQKELWEQERVSGDDLLRTLYLIYEQRVKRLEGAGRSTPREIALHNLNLGFQVGELKEELLAITQHVLEHHSKAICLTDLHRPGSAQWIVRANHFNPDVHGRYFYGRVDGGELQMGTYDQWEKALARPGVPSEVVNVHCTNQTPSRIQ